MTVLNKISILSLATVLAFGAAVYANAAPVKKKEEITRNSQESTTEYLNRKAQQDELEHKKEAMQQQREERKNYGSITYAGRWYEGDPVPDSRKLVRCGYCGAENLVPLHDVVSKYNCYFCREKL